MNKNSGNTMRNKVAYGHLEYRTKQLYILVTSETVDPLLI